MHQIDRGLLSVESSSHHIGSPSSSGERTDTLSDRGLEPSPHSSHFPYFRYSSASVGNSSATISNRPQDNLTTDEIFLLTHSSQ